MRMLLKAHIPVEQGNRVVQDGTIKKVVGEVMNQIKPEAAYFLAENGMRGCYMIFDMTDSTDIPSIAEPLFQEMNAELELIPVMNIDELGEGLQKLK
jgi:hypothetical protein